MSKSIRDVKSISQMEEVLKEQGIYVPIEEFFRCQKITELIKICIKYGAK